MYELQKKIYRNMFGNSVHVVLKKKLVSAKFDYCCSEYKMLNYMLLFLVLQWTPKDSQARLKVNGRCDDVMALVMKQFGLLVPPYNK